jgi:class 3 adenylate cyclase
VQHFLGLAGELAAKSAHRPLTKNTWGDGLYFAFSNVRGAGQFALDLRDVVRNTDWSKHGLPLLNLRIGLHAGPVSSCRDPATQQTTYVGANVNRAARIEPITPTSQVYASQTFAALAAAEGEWSFAAIMWAKLRWQKNTEPFQPTSCSVARRRCEEPL